MNCGCVIRILLNWLYLMGVEKVICYNNKLTELIVSAGCKKVSCSNNQLKELIITEGCVKVDCSYNQLKELIIPDGCVYVWADMKSVTELNKVKDLNLWIWKVIVKTIKEKLLN